MGLTISHASALEVIRRLRASGRDLRNYPFYTSLNRPSIWEGKRWRKRTFLNKKWLWGQPSPKHRLDVLVPHANDRLGMSAIDSHVCVPNLPKHSILWIDEYSSVVSPALLFKQMAEVLSFSEIVLLGYELCGTYALDADCPEHGKATLNIPPAVTVEELRQFLDALRHTHGVTSAREAVKYVADGAASVMEGVLGTVYSLPPEWCGYGMGPLRLNESAWIPKKMRSGDHQYRKPDILFPFCKVGINYDGSDHLKLDELGVLLKSYLAKEDSSETWDSIDKVLKSVREKAVDDMYRDRELAAKGNLVLRVMKEDLYEPGGLDRVTAQLLACARNYYGVDTTEFEHNLADPEKARNRQELLNSLLPAGTANPRSEDTNG